MSEKPHTPPSPTHYNVYHIYSHGTPDHEAIFIETHESGNLSGNTYRVIGNILTGMQYDDKPSERPEASAEFHRKSFIDHVKRSDYGTIQNICRRIAVPGKQLDLSGRRLDESKPVRRCGEWVKDTIVAMRDAGVLVP